MKNTFLKRLLVSTTLISAVYTPTLYGMYEEIEEENSNKTVSTIQTIDFSKIEYKAIVTKQKQNLFSIKGPLEPWQPINHTGDFDKAPKNLSELLKTYITQVANGKLDTAKWSAYFAQKDLDAARSLFKQAKIKDQPIDEIKLTLYLNEYLNHDFTSFAKNRDQLDTYFFKPQNLPFLKIIRPLLETIAFYKKDDPRFNCVGMHYLGWISEIEEKENESLNWYSMSALLGRIAEFQLPLYLKIYDGSKEHKTLMAGMKNGTLTKKKKEEIEKFFFGLKDNQSLLFYKESLGRLEKWKVEDNISAVNYCEYVDIKSLVVAQYFPFFQDGELKNSFHVPCLPQYLSWSLQSAQHILDPLVKVNDELPPFLQSKIAFFFLEQNAKRTLSLKNNTEIQRIVSDYHNRCNAKIVSSIVRTLSMLIQWDDALLFAKTSCDIKSKMIWVSMAIENFIYQRDVKNNKTIASFIEEMVVKHANSASFHDIADREIYFLYHGMSQFVLLNASDKTKGFLEAIALTENALLFAQDEEMRTTTLSRKHRLDKGFLFYCEYANINALRKILGLNLVDLSEIGNFPNNREEKANEVRIFFDDEKSTFDDLQKEHEELEKLYLEKLEKLYQERLYQEKLDKELEEQQKREEEKKLLQIENNKEENNIIIPLSTETKGENLSQYKIKKEKIILESGEERKKRIDQIKLDYEEGRKDPGRTPMSLTNIRDNLNQQKDLTNIEKAYLTFCFDGTLDNNFAAVVNDMKYYGAELKGKGKPEKIKGADYYTRRITKAARIVYNVEEGKITIVDITTDHAKYMKVIN